MIRLLAITAVGILLAAGCTLRGPREIRVTVQVPPAARSRAIPDYQCVFVDVMGPNLAEKSKQCWIRAQVSGAVWRGGSSTPLSVPMMVLPGKDQTIKVLSLEGSNVNSMSCHGPIEELIRGGAQVYQYASTTADIFAGNVIDIFPTAAAQSGGALSACAGGGNRQLTGYEINPAPNLAIGGTRQMRLYAKYNDGSSEEVTSGVSWSVTSTPPASASISVGGLLTGIATSSITVIAGYQGQNYTINGSVAGTILYVADNGSTLR